MHSSHPVGNHLYEIPPPAATSGAAKPVESSGKARISEGKSFFKPSFSILNAGELSRRSPPIMASGGAPPCRRSSRCQYHQSSSYSFSCSRKGDLESSRELKRASPFVLLEWRHILSFAGGATAMGALAGAGGTLTRGGTAVGETPCGAPTTRGEPML